MRPAAGPSRQRPQSNAAPTSKPAVPAPIEKSANKAEITKEKPKIVAEKPREKPKLTGKLNFTKAKAKEAEDEPKAEQKKKESAKAASTLKFKSGGLKSKEAPRKEETLPEEVKVCQVYYLSSL